MLSVGYWSNHRIAQTLHPWWTRQCPDNLHVHDRDKQWVSEAAIDSKFMKVFSRYIIAFTSFLIGLIGDHAHWSSVHPREPHNNVSGIVGHYLKEVTLINNQSNDVQDVVWLVGRMRNDVIETRNHTIPMIMCVHVGVMCVYTLYVCMCLNVYKHVHVKF